MDEDEVFIKALEKAEMMGYLLPFTRKIQGVEPYSGLVYDMSIWDSRDVEYYGLYKILFSHEFAKAFFGNEWVCSNTGRTRKEYFDHHSDIYDKRLLSDGWDVKPKEKAWKYHLQQMVLEENPLEYLERFLDD